MKNIIKTTVAAVLIPVAAICVLSFLECSRIERGEQKYINYDDNRIIPEKPSGQEKND